jgi:hypothetical protein
MILQLGQDTATEIDQDEIQILEATVLHRVCGRVRNLRLVILETGIILQGQVVTYHAKQLAQHALMTATKMPILANEIEVV